MISSRYGNDLTLETAVFDAEGHGPMVGAIAIRNEDKARRYYMLHQMQADGGHAEIMGALQALPCVQADSQEFQEALER
jgi:hypothetical protein